MKQLRLHYAWVVAAVTFGVLVVTAAVRATPSILIVPLEQQFGWSRSTISLAVSINLLLYGLTGPFAAGLLNRYGSRGVTLFSLALLAGGVGLTTQMKDSWQLVLLWGLLVGFGSGMTAIVLGATVVHRWFRKREGLIIGVLTASSATGQLLFLPMLASLIDRHGWKMAVWVVVAALSISWLVVSVGMRNDPAEIGLRPYGVKTSEPIVDPLPLANPVRQAFSALSLGGYYALRGLSLLFLPEAFNPSTSRLTIFAVFYGLDWIATVPPTVALAAKIFGRENAGLMFGWIFASHQVGAAATAFFAGFIRSMEGSYDRAFLISGVACVLTAFGVLLIGTGKCDRAAALRFSS
jgi:sugar phosphate permease